MSLYDRIESDFTYHPPTGEEQIQRFKIIRDLARDFAHTIDALVSEGREKSIALTKLEEVVTWSNSGIAREHGV